MLLVRLSCACGPAEFHPPGRVKWEGEIAPVGEGEIVSYKFASVRGELYPYTSIRIRIFVLQHSAPVRVLDFCRGNVSRSPLRPFGFSGVAQFSRHHAPNPVSRQGMCISGAQGARHVRGDVMSRQSMCTRGAPGRWPCPGRRRAHAECGHEGRPQALGGVVSRQNMGTWGPGRWSCPGRASCPGRICAQEAQYSECRGGAMSATWRL